MKSRVALYAPGVHFQWPAGSRNAVAGAPRIREAPRAFHHRRIRRQDVGFEGFPPGAEPTDGGRKPTEVRRCAGLHLLRHACATHMLDNGCPLDVISHILGHDNIDVTAHYAQVTRRTRLRV